MVTLNVDLEPQACGIWRIAEASVVMILNFVVEFVLMMRRMFPLQA